MTSDDIKRSPNPALGHAQQTGMGTFYCDHCNRKGRSVAGSAYRYHRGYRKAKPACAECVGVADAREAA